MITDFKYLENREYNKDSYFKEVAKYDSEKVCFDLSNCPGLSFEEYRKYENEFYDRCSDLHDKYKANVSWHNMITYYKHETNHCVIAFAIYEDRVESIFSSGWYTIYYFNGDLLIKPEGSNQEFFDKINKYYYLDIDSSE